MTSVLTILRGGPAAIREAISRNRIGDRNIVDATDRQAIAEKVRYGPDGRPTWLEEIGGPEWRRRVREGDHE